MKTTFSSLDIACCVYELQSLVGMRVNQIYDVDHKTYLFKLHQQDKKSVLLIESGARFHITTFEWPKNVTPSGFTMKLRKHLKNKRIEKIQQLGNDRIVDIQFGIGEAAYHVILELFNRGNIILTDYMLVSLNVLRPHTEGDQYKFSVREPYPICRVRDCCGALSVGQLEDIFKNAKTGDKMSKLLLNHLDYGQSLIEHLLILAGFNKNSKYNGEIDKEEIEMLADTLKMGECILEKVKTRPSKGYIIILEESRLDQEKLITYLEFHPYLFLQNKRSLFLEYDTFNAALDEYYSKTEGQKIELKTLQLSGASNQTSVSQKAESLKCALIESILRSLNSMNAHFKKLEKALRNKQSLAEGSGNHLENVAKGKKLTDTERESLQRIEKMKENQRKRVENLVTSQEENRRKAELIMGNSKTIDEIIMTVRRAIALQMTWPDIAQMFSDMARHGHSNFNAIHSFKLEINHITLALSDPYEDTDTETERTTTLVDIDLSLSACANATRYYSNKKTAAVKERKTMESQDKAVKSATKKAKLTLKDLKTTATIKKARKVYWFEKFFWFISSDNYLVIAGRDQQQNEAIVKRYLKKGDIYVHADLNGASSVVIKNPQGTPIPPRTLNEAGNMAVCYSIGWEAKVMCSAWWVRHDQVSKAAPAGEYLTTGSFMIRGQKNFLLPAQLALGFGFMFKLEESSVFRHTDERKAKTGPLEDLFFEEEFLEVEEPQPEPITSTASINDDAKLADDETVDDIEPNIYNETLVPQDDIPQTEECSFNNEEVLGYLTKNEVSKPETSSSDEVEEVEEEGAGIGKIISQEKLTRRDAKRCQEFPDVDANLSHEMDRLDLQTKVKFDLETKNTDRRYSAAGTSKQAQTKDDKSGDKNILKRGQRSKLKKIKGKYKDQDEEEKRLRMSILKSDGTKKEPKKSKKIKQPEIRSKPTNTENRQPNRSAPKVPNDEEAGDDEEEEDLMAEELSVIDFLTGQPHPEDELLFAVPVVAPYTALLNYKYKVKMIPGNGKRGKCARSAQDYFLKLKDSTAQEKTLIKNVDDNILSRNFPGKVKLAYAVQKK